MIVLADGGYINDGAFPGGMFDDLAIQVIVKNATAAHYVNGTLSHSFISDEFDVVLGPGIVSDSFLFESTNGEIVFECEIQSMDAVDEILLFEARPFQPMFREGNAVYPLNWRTLSVLDENMQPVPHASFTNPTLHFWDIVGDLNVYIPNTSVEIKKVYISELNGIKLYAGFRMLWNPFSNAYSIITNVRGIGGTLLPVTITVVTQDGREFVFKDLTPEERPYVFDIPEFSSTTGWKVFK